MQIQYNFPLQQLNTFGLAAFAERFCVVNDTNELSQILELKNGPLHILGGGSNILLTGDVPSLLIQNKIEGIAILEETAEQATIAAGGGVVWHELVLWSLAHQLGGLENLSLIPGSVGASPIQNIGAYGVELKDIFHSLEAVELSSGETKTFYAEDCRFGYRDSIFKNELKGQYFITRVCLKLSKQPQLKLDYGDIRRTLEDMQIHSPTIHDVSRAVIHIRQSKLPDPAEIGNAGSFFKNPEIDAENWQWLKEKFPHIVGYALSSGGYKVPAGWLIEQAGWKGKRIGDAGCHARQALVLVNYGQAKGADILALAQSIQQSVKELFGIALTPEVNVW